MSFGPPHAPTRGRVGGIARRAVLGIALLGLAAGCQRMAVEGRVTDVAGDPLEGVMVSLLGSPCYGQSGADGTFEVTCPPGQYDVSLALNGYISEIVESLDASERKRYDLGTQVLIRIPKEKGLFLMEGGKYLELQPGQLRRIKGGGRGMGQYKWYCLDEPQSEPNRLDAGSHRFFDNKSEGWRIFRLDGDDCAYRTSPVSATRWGIDYNEKPELERRHVGEGRAIVEVELEPGEYFVADWKKGFFTKVSGKKYRYTGYYLVVEP